MEHGHLRLLTSAGDTRKCDELIVRHHSLQSGTLVGEPRRYAYVYQGQWLAVATGSSAAFHLKDRDQFIGWSQEQCRRRRALIAHNSRLLVLPQGQCPNRSSRLMKLMLGRLWADWEQRWGHPLALVETFVDPRSDQGTAYKVSGWSHLGRPAGGKPEADAFYEKNDAPKQIWVRELVKKARVKLRAPELPAAGAKVEAGVAPRCTAKATEICRLMDLVRAKTPEFRRAPARAYPVAGMIGVMVMAAAQGVARGPQDLALYADPLSPGQRRALRFRREARTGKLRRPQKTTLTRVGPPLDEDLLEQGRLQWQEQIRGPPQDRIGIIDGQKVRHAGVEIVNAVDSPGRFLGRVLTQPQRHEIPAGRHRLHQLDLSARWRVARPPPVRSASPVPGGPLAWRPGASVRANPVGRWSI